MPRTHIELDTVAYVYHPTVGRREGRQERTWKLADQLAWTMKQLSQRPCLKVEGRDCHLTLSPDFHICVVALHTCIRIGAHIHKPHVYIQSTNTEKERAHFYSKACLMESIKLRICQCTNLLKRSESYDPVTFQRPHSRHCYFSY